MRLYPVLLLPALVAWLLLWQAPSPAPHPRAAPSTTSHGQWLRLKGTAPATDTAPGLAQHAPRPLPWASRPPDISHPIYTPAHLYPPVRALRM